MCTEHVQSGGKSYTAKRQQSLASQVGRAALRGESFRGVAISNAQRWGNGLCLEMVCETTEVINMLWTILMILLVLWLLGLIGQVGGAFIHLLLVVALVVFLIQLLSGRRVAL